MLSALFNPRWKLVGPTPEGMSILRAEGPHGHDLYSVTSPYNKMPLLAPRTRWTWTRPRPGERPVFEGSPYLEGHVRELHSWFFDIPALHQMGFAPTMGVFLDFENPPMNEEEAALRLEDIAKLHEETFWHHADWRCRP